MKSSFSTNDRYFDDENYPYGFSRHGNLTIKEARLLESFGQAYDDLHKGRRKPVTEEEKKFVAVCNGTRIPYSEHEKVWIKYLKNIKKQKKFHTLSGGKFNYDTLSSYNEN